MYTTSNQPLPYVQPYLQDYLARQQDVSNTPYTQSPGQYADPNSYLNSGWQAIANRAMQGSPVMDAGNKTLTDTLNGSFLNANPYLDQSISNAQGDLTKAWNTVAKPSWETAMLGGGSFGNSGVQEASNNAQGQLQQNLGRVASDMRSNAYNTERGYQQSALGLAPTYANQDYTDANQLLTAGTQQQGYQDRNAQQNYNWWNEAQQYPQQRLNSLGTALGVGVNSGSQTEQPGVSAGTSALGGALIGSQLGGNMGIGQGWGGLLGGLLGYFGK